MLITLITLNYYRNNKRRLLQNEIIHQQKIKEKSTEAKLAVKNAILESDEQERQRIAQDLHDSMGECLPISECLSLKKILKTRVNCCNK